MTNHDHKLDVLLTKIVTDTATEADRREFDMLSAEPSVGSILAYPRPTDDEMERFDALVEKYAHQR